MKIQYVLSLKESLQMLADADRANAHRCSGKDKVACLECTEAANVFYYPRNGEYHIGSMSILHGLAVYVKIEVQVLQVTYLLLWNPVTYHGRLVKAFAELPRHTLAAQIILHITSREIYAQRHSVPVSVRKTGADALAQTVYPHHKLRLIVYSAQMVGQKKGTAVPQD